MQETPHSSHLDERDPAKVGLNIREDVDQEIDHYGRDLHELVLLVPEDRWAEFLSLSGCEAHDGEASYRGVTLRRAPVTDVVAQEGF